jgi:putative membrane protein
MIFRIMSHGRALVLPGLAVLLVASGSSWELWLMALFVPSISFELFRYLTLRYGMMGPDLVVRHGLIFKVERHIPLERIQNVDLVQNPLHRLLRVAEVRVETAGGSEPEAVLKVLSLDAVERLRRSIFAGRLTAPAPGAAPTLAPDGPTSATAPGAPAPGSMHAPAPAPALTPTDAPGSASAHAPVPCVPGASPASSSAAAPTTPALAPSGPPAPDTAAPRDGAARMLLRLGAGELVKVGVISLRGAALVAVLLGIAWEFDLEDRIDLGWIERGLEAVQNHSGPLALAAAGTLLILGAIAILYALSIAWALLRLYDFTLQRSGDDLRLRCGLLTRISATIPRRRVQLVTVRQTLVHRLFHRVAVRVQTAGAHEEHGDAISRKWFVPIATATAAASVLREVRPGLDLGDAPWQPLSRRGRRRMVRMGILMSLLPAAILLILGATWLGWWLAALALPLPLVGAWHAWREAGFMAWTLLPGGIAFRSGVLTRNTSATFFDKIQALRLSQSPFDRRWNMATLAVDTAGAAAATHRVRIPYLELETARAALRALTRGTEGAEFTW